MTPTKPYSIQSPQQIAMEYGGNKQKIAAAAQMGLIDPTSAVLAGMFIDRMHSNAMRQGAAQPTVAQQVFAPPQPPMQMGMPVQQPPMPPMAPQGPGMAEGGVAGIDVPDTMYDEPSNGGFNDGYAPGGLVAFAAGGADEEDDDEEDDGADIGADDDDMSDMYGGSPYGAGMLGAGAAMAQPAGLAGAAYGPGIQGLAQQIIPGIITTSGYRSAAHNAQVGGVRGSYHLTNDARDFVPPKGMSMKELANHLTTAFGPDYKVLNEGNHVHVQSKTRSPGRGENSFAKGAAVEDDSDGGDITDIGAPGWDPNGAYSPTPDVQAAQPLDPNQSIYGIDLSSPLANIGIARQMVGTPDTTYEDKYKQYMLDQLQHGGEDAQRRAKGLALLSIGQGLLSNPTLGGGLASGIGAAGPILARAQQDATAQQGSLLKGLMDLQQGKATREADAAKTAFNLYQTGIRAKGTQDTIASRLSAAQLMAQTRAQIAASNQAAAMDRAKLRAGNAGTKLAQDAVAKANRDAHNEMVAWDKLNPKRSAESDGAYNTRRNSVAQAILNKYYTQYGVTGGQPAPSGGSGGRPPLSSFMK